jgi:isoquinoline 1-oxidoreductase beta subunit
MTGITNLSRREVLKGVALGSGLVLGLHVGSRKFPFGGVAEAAGASSSLFEPNVFLSIDDTGLVTIVASRAEMGTGIKTDLPLVLADELEADWSRVKITQAQGDPKYGDQNTDGSRSTWQFFGPMRTAGATARHMLEAAAAGVWQVPAGECQAQNGFVVHSASGRKLAFGNLAKLAATMPVPPSNQVRLKDRKDWRYIGKPHPIVDLEDIVRGRAIYGIDVVIPGMKYASIERCPVYGGKVKSFDAEAALSIAGVERVVEIPATPMPSGFKPLGGVAVIANDTWSAQQGRQRLKINWDYGPNAVYDTETYRAELEATARQPGKVVRNNGNVDGALSAAVKHVSADYFVPHLAHAQMEVPNAVAHWVANSCEIWAPTQHPAQVRQTVAQVLGLNEADITINVTLLGGGFGRKSKPDYVAEAALLSRMAGTPIKVTWTREDDIQHDYYHAVCAQHLEAGLDQDGRATAWLHRTVFPPIEATFQPDVVYGSGGELGQGVVDMPYDIPNVRCENGAAANHVRIGWYRSVYNIPHAFAVCSFADELAVAAGKDPVEYLRELLGPPRILDFKALGLRVDYPNYGVDQLAPGIAAQYPIDTARYAASSISSPPTATGVSSCRQGKAAALQSIAVSLAMWRSWHMSRSATTAKSRYRGSTWRLIAGSSLTRIECAPNLKGPQSWRSAIRSTATPHSNKDEPSRAITPITWWRAPISPRRPTFILSRTTTCQVVSASRACHRPGLRFAMRSMQPPANGSGPCRSTRSC